MLTVGKNGAEVERLLGWGLLACPGCAGRLRPWGHARVRVLRLAGRGRWRVRPRRSVCAGCGRTHVLLPAGVLARRADAAVVIGRAVSMAAGGRGYRAAAARLGRAEGTVRGWLRRFASRAARLRQAFTALACALDPDPSLPGPSGSVVADAVAAIGAAAAAAARRWAGRAAAVSPWDLASAVTSGLLLSPGWDGRAGNTSCPW